MGKGSAKAQVTDYYMSIHYGICMEADALLGIYVGEKSAWEGEVGASPTAIAINRPQLFGGNKKEGGVAGTAYWLPGKYDQVLPEHLAQRLGRTSATAPGYRGVSSLWFHGGTATASNVVGWDAIAAALGQGFAAQGFLWSSNNPYLRDIWMKVRRAPKGLGDYLSQMVGSSSVVSVNHNQVTIDGTSATVIQGVAATVGGKSVLLDRKSLTIDGTQIIVDLDDEFISVGGVSQPIPSGKTMLTVNGVTVSISSSYNVTIGAGAIKVANFTARFNARIDANPIHIIYECMTNTDWGMGGAPSSFNTANFLECAQVIHDEGLGMSLTWANQSTVEAFVGDVIDHIQATIFINPRDGLWTIKLIRNDYDVDTLPVLNRDNCVITSFNRKAWGETTNEIVVTWTNPETEKEETVAAQNLANVTIQGAVISDSRNYHGFRNARVAAEVADRDLRLASAPLASMEIEVSRDAWNFVPGGVVRLDYPEPDYEIESLVIRISKIDYGKPGDPTIKINAIEDIWGLPVAAYRDPPPTEWVPSSEIAQPFDHSQIITAPLYFTTEALQAASLSGFEFPEVMTMVLGAQNSGDTFLFDTLGEGVDQTGNLDYNNLGTMAVAGHATLAASLAAEVTSTDVLLDNFTGGVEPAINRFLLIGDADETEMEIALISGVSLDGWTLERGVLDTVPREWPIDAPVWIVEVDSNIFDETARAGGEVVNYKLLTRTSLGSLPEADAPIITTTLTDRPWLPNRPADVRVNGTAFGSLSVADAPTIEVTWATRNRLMEPTAVTRWTDGSVTPEAGQTTRITILRPSDRSVINTVAGITGSAQTVDTILFNGEAAGIVRVTAERDGLESLQGHEITVNLTPVNRRVLSGDEAGALIPSGDANSGTDQRIWS